MDLESRLRLERDAVAVHEFLANNGGGVVHRDDDPVGLYWATIHPGVSDAVAFIARIEWSVYPDRPPSLKFTDTVGGPTSKSAWPAAQGYRADSLDVCKPFTAEGQALHAEWALGPHRWRTDGNPFLYVVETISDDINRVSGRRAA